MTQSIISMFAIPSLWSIAAVVILYFVLAGIIYLIERWCPQAIEQTTVEPEPEKPMTLHDWIQSIAITIIVVCILVAILILVLNQLGDSIINCANCTTAIAGASP